MDQDESRPSPGLNMDHGFLKKIEQNQFLREKQARDDVGKRSDSAKMARKVGFQIRSSKPAMEIYRPPSLRVSGDFTALAGGAGLPITPETIESIPWIPLQPAAMATTSTYDVQPIGLSKSRSTTSAHRVHFQLQPSIISSHPPSLSNNGNVGQAKKEASGGYGLKRSKSLGAGDMRLFTQDLDITSFNAETQAAIKRATDDPNKVPARQLMEIVRHLFNKVLDSCRYAEPTARLCIAIIQKERNETFLESLLNSCREWYNERDRLFEDGGGGSRSASCRHHPPMKPSRWVAYVTFLYELYTRLKTKKQTPMIATNTTPSALILTLLSECCLLFLKPSSLMGHSEIECLFIVLTSIGRDLQSEFPLRMQVLMNAIRDAFLAPSTPQPVRKTLLQLIELNASKWQLKAEAVTYYYPGNQRE